MKIKDFIHSSKKVNKTPSKFILSNESKERHLEHQIKELQIELNRLSEVDEKNKDLTQRASKYNSNEKSRIQEITSLRNEKRMVEEETERLRKFERANQSLTAQVKNIAAEVDNCKGTLELAKNNSIEKDKTLLNLQQRFDVLFKEEAGMRSELNQTQNKYQSQKVELDKYSKIYNETADLLKITEGTLKNTKEQVEYVKHEETFWHNRTMGLEQEVAQLKDVENNLRKWSSNLTEDSAKTSGMNKMKIIRIIGIIIFIIVLLYIMKSPLNG